VPSESRKILIVEDSPTMCQLYRMVLGALEGSELIFANNGVEGLDRLAQEAPLQLMIVDINMPRMDGLEFLKRAREELQVVDVPAIVISTEGDPADREAAEAAGASAYLRKPWTPDELLEAIRPLLSQSTGL
jgi:two-component system, chemotaxis family, chemotaxis protein CheY